MRVDDCYLLGEVIKTHGLKGEVSVLLDVDFPNSYSELESVFLEKQGKLVPFFIDTIQIGNDRALVKFEEIDSLEDAAQLVHQKLYLPLSQLPKLPDDQYYFHDLVGCIVQEKGKEIGTVKEVIDLSGNELLVVLDEEREILIPLKDGIVLDVSIAKKLIKVALPEGLLDLY
ncbi:MAG: ribosome maturation factor RimM [Bacteroidota bacterium]